MTTTDAETAHRRSLENLHEAQQYLNTCPQDELPAARLLFHVARLAETDARKAFVEALTAGVGAARRRDGISVSHAISSRYRP